MARHPTKKGIGSYQTKDGRTRWYFRYRPSPLSSGEVPKPRFQRGFESADEAEAAMWEERISRRRGTFIEPSREPVAQYLRRWLRTTAANRAPTTDITYTQALDRFIVHLGDVPLGALDAMTVQEAVSALQARYAPNTIRHDHGRLKQALQQAVRWKLIPSNPCDGVTLPPATEKRVTPWSAEQMAHFLHETANTPDHALFRTFLETGARIGELLALFWSDVDFEKGAITIARTVTRRKRADGSTERYIGDEPKTDAGRRTLPISQEAVAALRRHLTTQKSARLRAGGRWLDHNLVFPARNGQIRTAAHVARSLTREITRLHLPPLSAHGLRATNATVAVEYGADIKVLSQRLGHRTVNMTLNRYVHPSQDASRKVTDLLAGMLREEMATDENVSM